MTELDSSFRRDHEVPIDSMRGLLKMVLNFAEVRKNCILTISQFLVVLPSNALKY